MSKNVQKAAIIWAITLMVGFFLSGHAANAQQFNQAWGFTTQNRASIAALMQQVEKSEGTGNAVASGGGYDSLVCGGDGMSSATGNSTCIILNNSDGSIQVGQDSQGNQESSNTEDTTISGLSNALEDIDKNEN